MGAVMRRGEHWVVRLNLYQGAEVGSFSEARESFKAVLDRVEADADVTLITRRHA